MDIVEVQHLIRRVQPFNLEKADWLLRWLAAASFWVQNAAVVYFCNPPKLVWQIDLVNIMGRWRKPFRIRQDSDLVASAELVLIHFAVSVDGDDELFLAHHAVSKVVHGH